MHFKSWQDWQQQYKANIACKGLHTKFVDFHCICCQSAIKIDTDKEINVDTLKCQNCKDIEPNYLIAAKMLQLLNATLFKHFRF